MKRAAKSILVLALLSIIVLSLSGCSLFYVDDCDLYEPEIKCGEFDFKVVYQVMGQEYTVEDTPVCAFEKVPRGFDAGYQVHFTPYIKSSGVVSEEQESALCEKYQLRVVFFEHAPPIVNNYPNRDRTE